MLRSFSSKSALIRTCGGVALITCVPNDSVDVLRIGMLEVQTVTCELCEGGRDITFDQTMHLDCIAFLPDLVNNSWLETCVAAAPSGITNLLHMAVSKEVIPAKAGIDPNTASCIKRASALRVKYRVYAQPTLFHNSLVAQHPKNRGGIAINGSRCDEIVRQIIGHFDEEEANHGAVAIEENPSTSNRYRDYNKDKSAGDPTLAEVSEDASAVAASQSGTWSRVSAADVSVVCPSHVSVWGCIRGSTSCILIV